MINVRNDNRKITLDRVNSFVSGRQALDSAYVNPVYPDGSPKEISAVGLLASTIAEFAQTKDYDTARVLAVDLSMMCKDGQMKVGNDGAYVLDTRFGKIRFFRLVEMTKDDQLHKLYFDSVTQKPFNNTIRLLARNKNAALFDHVVGLTDLYHWTNDDLEGYLSSWMETDFGKGDKSRAYVIDPSLRLAMPRDDYYYLFASQVYNRVKGSDIAVDLKNPKIKEEMIRKENYGYIFCRDELVKKLEQGEMGE